MKRLFPLVLFACSVTLASDFAQLGSLLPDPSEARLASGAPGPAYWQQEANYKIDVELDEANSRIIGSETIEYTNHSPHTLPYVWVQLDQNALAQDSKRQRMQQGPNFEGSPGKPAEINYSSLRSLVLNQEFEGGNVLKAVTDNKGNDLPYSVVNTNMRIDLPKPLSTGDSITLKIDWEFAIQEDGINFRHGKKRLENGDFAYQLAQWYPRMCAYYDLQGWQVRPYIGSGEFALEFGNFEVHITAPDDFVVAATGELSNANKVLSSEQRNRLQEARGSDEPVFIVTPEEAEANLESKSDGKKTWIFKADKVRDFAFAASRGYIWDAKSMEIEGRTIMTMSAYPKEASPVWRRFSTEAIVQAIKTYSRLVYPYPYPVMWSAWGAAGGMEYPMMTFQSTYRIDDKETYPVRERNYVIGVVIHEVGHNWFPMIINSDERQWMWMDEGLNSFVEHLAATEFDPVIQESYENGTRRVIASMARASDPVIMMSADELTQRGYQAYTKPALGLMVLRESILGRELFDFAFGEYARRWAFKRPTPADFFRTMEDASGVDLDWFWRNWFYGNDHVDMAIESVKIYKLDDGNPETSKELDREEESEIPDTPYEAFLKEIETITSQSERLQDWYYSYDKYETTEKDAKDYEKKIEKLEDWEKEQLEFADYACVVQIKNVGGHPMPLVLDVTFEDGSERRIQAPVETWQPEKSSVRIPFLSSQPVSKVQLDRDNAFADSNLKNNIFPREIEEGRFKLKQPTKAPNPMRKGLFPKEEKDENEDEESNP